MTDIAVRADYELPVKFEDVASFAVIAQEKLKSVRAEISAIKRLGLAQEVLQQKVQEAQQLAEVKTRAEVRLGELTAAMPKATGARTDLTSSSRDTRLKTKEEALSQVKITKQQASQYELMAAHPEIVEQAIAEARENDDIVSRSLVLNMIKTQKKAEQIEQAKANIARQTQKGETAVLYIGDGIGHIPEEPYDLLLTDPPYSTDVEDIESFAQSWLPNALEHVKPTGSAYVFIGAYPEELRAYLNVEVPEHMTLKQVLIWTYKNTLGNNPKDRYKQNYQACLFYRGIKAPALDCPLTNEQWAVQEVNAPDGRLGDRYHAWQKPMELAERFIRHSTKNGNTVFDPFACTGTFLLAAAKLGRKGYGYEISRENAEIAQSRGIEINECSKDGYGEKQQLRRSAS